MNKFMLNGRLVSDPEIRMTTGEKPTHVAIFTVATQRPFNKDKADFFRCNLFGKRAERFGEFFHKGSRILITDARIQIDNQKQEDGTYKTYVNVIVNDYEFVDTKAESAGNATPATAPAAAPTPAPAPTPTPAAQAAQEGFMELPDPGEELPFI